MLRFLQGHGQDAAGPQPPGGSAGLKDSVLRHPCGGGQLQPPTPPRAAGWGPRQEAGRWLPLGLLSPRGAGLLWHGRPESTLDMATTHLRDVTWEETCITPGTIRGLEANCVICPHSGGRDGTRRRGPRGASEQSPAAVSVTKIVRVPEE